MKYRKLIPIIALCLPMSVVASTEYIPKKSSIDKLMPNTESCEQPQYQPRKPVNNLDTSINSVNDFSPTVSGHPWYTFDHIGYKDSAFQGERHVAYFPDEGGVQFYGYDSEKLADLMLIEHKSSPNQTITLLQAPLRADWHTLDGNGVMFGVTPNNLPPNPGDINVTNNANKTTITGYAAVATADEIQIRKYTNATINDLTTKFDILYTQPKQCPSVDFVIEIIGNKAKVYLGTDLLKEIVIDAAGRYTGILVCYAEHNCNSLSSVYTYSHVVNDIEYLMPKQ